MTPTEYKNLIGIPLTDQEFQTFKDIAITFGTAKPVLEHWNKFKKDGNTNVMEFQDYMIDVWMEVKG